VLFSALKEGRELPPQKEKDRTVEDTMTVIKKFSVEGSVGLLANFPFPEEFVWTLCHTVIFMSYHIHFHLPHIYSNSS